MGADTAIVRGVLSRRGQGPAARGRSSTARTRPGRGSWRRGSRASWARARRRSARRCATSRRWGSSRSRRSAGPACGGPSLDELLEAYVVRAELEALAARLAMPRPRRRDLDGVAAALLDEMLRCAEAGDTIGEAAADAAFHASLVDRAGNATLRRVWGTLEPYSRTYINMAVPGADRRRDGRAPPPGPRRRSARATRRSPRPRSASTSRPPAGRSPTAGRTIGAAAGARRIRAAPPKGPDERRPAADRGVLGGRRPPPRRRRSAGRRASHVLDDLSFLDYRLADVRMSPRRSTLERAGHRVDPGRAEVGHAWGRRVTFTGDWAAGPLQKVIVAVLALKLEDVGLHAEPQRRGQLPRQDVPVPRRRVQPRQDDGPDRGGRPRRPAGVVRDHGHRRGRARRDGLEGRVPAHAQRGHGALRQGRAEQGRGALLGRAAELGAVRGDPGHRSRDRPDARRQRRHRR